LEEKKKKDTIGISVKISAEMLNSGSRKSGYNLGQGRATKLIMQNKATTTR
jgi:hypothetical protein